MKVLFVMAYPGYLRYYDTVVHELTARGHEVVLGWESPGKQSEGRDAVAGAERVTDLDRIPLRDDTWAPPLRHLRRITDFLRYLDPVFADADFLRDRTGALVTPRMRWLNRYRTAHRKPLNALLGALLAVERSVPPSKRMTAWLRDVNPGVVVLTPLLTDASRLVDVLKSARSLGLPVVMGVASWDHLTTKGLIRQLPDRVILWNEVQREEARSLHGIPDDRIAVTGAQPFDRWFTRKASLDRRAFADRVRLRLDEPFVLFVGSTASISKPELELEFVRKWVSALRASGDPRLTNVPVLVRPHPYNPGLWPDADLTDLGDVAVWPRGAANIVDPQNRDDYFHSLRYASAVVGINTSAFIEASVVGRTTLTIRAEEFNGSQGGTLHFHYLRRANGGPLIEADSLEEHVEQLSRALADPEAERRAVEAFVGSFVRPRGLEFPATPIVVDEIEAAVSLAAPRWTPGPARWPLAALLWVTGTCLAFTDEGDRRLYRKSLNKAKHKHPAVQWARLRRKRARKRLVRARVTLGRLAGRGDARDGVVVPGSALHDRAAADREGARR